jgi:hypothetical protein
MLALADAAFARLCIGATAVRQRRRRQWLKDVCYLSSGQTGKRFLPKRSFGSIHSTCLSALVTVRAMEAWYDASIA